MPGSAAEGSRLGRVFAVTNPANKTNTGMTSSRLCLDRFLIKYGLYSVCSIYLPRIASEGI